MQGEMLTLLLFYFVIASLCLLLYTLSIQFMRLSMQIQQDLERWLSVDEIAFHLGVSKESIYRWAENGKIPAHKLGRKWRFRASEVDEWIMRGKASEKDLVN